MKETMRVGFTTLQELEAATAVAQATQAELDRTVTWLPRELVTENASGVQMKRVYDNRKDYRVSFKLCSERLPGETAVAQALEQRLSIEIAALQAAVLKVSADEKTDPLRAARSVAGRLLTALMAKKEEITGKNAARMATLVTFKDKMRTNRPPMPARLFLTGQVRKLEEALLRSLELLDKTWASYHTAKGFVDKLGELKQKKFDDPKRPTAEEVAKYLVVLEKWYHEVLPLDRQTGEKVIEYRKLLLALVNSVASLRKLVGKLGYLVKHSIAPEMEALVESAIAIHTELRRQMPNLLSLEDRCKFQKFNTSPEVTELTEDHLVLIEALRECCKQVAVAAGNKEMCRIHYQRLKDKCPKLNLPTVPAFHIGRDTDYAKLFTGADEFLHTTEKVRRDTMLKEAEVETAYDAFLARRDVTRKAATKATKNAATLARTPPKTLVPDEVQVLLGIINKLYDLHGSMF